MLKVSKEVARKWYGSNNGGGRASITELEKRITALESEMQNGIAAPDAWDRMIVLKKALWHEYRIEESIWIQKSRLKWIQEGDRNTRFFHLVASERKRVNAIKSLLVDNVMVEDPLNVKKAVVDHFRDAYNRTHALDIKNIGLDFGKVNEEERLSLQKPFTEGEI
ncbi:hypothetical protein HRI_002913700 [Hibiscus trionum]|uniref:Uncharacterized protein n=1 Tax=Hibiscus trionum TaxID=183268 RepID=A0A9W7I8G5_HIBTR|nr:hypothetical protein HRI_002913700 [Hibiscus trionum]